MTYWAIGKKSTNKIHDYTKKYVSLQVRLFNVY